MKLKKELKNLEKYGRCSKKLDFLSAADLRDKIELLKKKLK